MRPGFFPGCWPDCRRYPGCAYSASPILTASAERTPTACFTLPGLAPAVIAEKMGATGIYVWEGNYYAWEPMKFLGLEENGGAVRAGLCLYNTGRGSGSLPRGAARDGCPQVSGAGDLTGSGAFIIIFFTGTAG